MLYERAATTIVHSVMTGSFLAGRRPMAVDGFGLDVPDEAMTVRVVEYEILGPADVPAPILAAARHVR
ncbi:hypothetical protein ND747_01075 [Frankia sp. R82]|nr:hypothetical protein [Frankia sp. R82]MCM3882248.1 hypothetical protein [Frankia sp. R82]